MVSELVIAREKLESFLPILGTEVTEEGVLRDAESKEVHRDDTGEELTVEDIGYLGHGSVEPVEDNFSAIVSHLSDREFRDD